jgi:hypothetical protein
MKNGKQFSFYDGTFFFRKVKNKKALHFQNEQMKIKFEGNF